MSRRQHGLIGALAVAAVAATLAPSASAASQDLRSPDARDAARATAAAPMRIDATALTSTSFLLSRTSAPAETVGVFQGTSIESVDLIAGDYQFVMGAGLVMRCAVAVTDAGAWDYATACDGFLAGRGTDTLQLAGYEVTIDATPLATPLVFTNLFSLSSTSQEPFRGPRQVRLMPTFNDYLFTPGPGVVGECAFGVGLDGNIAYPDRFEGCLSGRGTRTVTLNGFPINVDARQLSTTEFNIIQAFTLFNQPSGVVQTYRLLPPLVGSYGSWQAGGLVWPSLGLTVDFDGHVGYPSSADGWVTGRGTDTLVIHGYAIEIDATATAPGTFRIPDAVGTGTRDRATVQALRLAPIAYAYSSGAGTDFFWSIREQDGTIDFGDDAGYCVSGQGTTRVTVSCVTPPPEPPPPGEPPPTTSPPAPTAPENVTAPQIRSVGDGSYTCDPGEWRNVGKPPGFTFKWLVYRTPDAPPDTVAETQSYTPGASVYGYPVACQVTVAGPDGPVTATSAQVFFSSAGLNTLPPAYGDVRIRGIDVFQTVQPNTGAPMFGYKPDGVFDIGLCGGGTPTNWRLTPIEFSGPFGPFTVVRCELGDRDAQFVNYEGVTLDRYKRTTAVVYVDVAGASAADPDLTYDLELSAMRSGGASLGEPLVVSVKNPPRSDNPYVEAWERDNVESFAFEDNRHGIPILLPSAWTSPGGSIRLQARLRFPDRLHYGTAGYGTRQCDSPGCDANDVFTLHDIPFADLPQLRFAPLELRQIRDGQTALPAPDQVLARPRQLFPGGDRMVVPPYRASLDISDVDTLNAAAVPGTSNFTCNGQTGPNITTRNCRRAYVSQIVQRWITENPARATSLRGSSARYDVAFGVHDYDLGNGTREPGWSTGDIDITAVSRTEPRQASTTPNFTATAFTRPLTAAGHELGHILTAPHADSDLTPNTCGGNTPPEVGETWNPDGTGRLQGTKFVRPRLARAGRVNITVDGPYTLPSGARYNGDMFDLMSYCTFGDDARAWLSARNWNRAFRELSDLGGRLASSSSSTRAARGAARRAPVGGRTAFAVGVAGRAGGRITRVVPPDGDDAVPDPVPSSPFMLRSLDASGRTLLEAGVEVRPLTGTGKEAVGPFAGPVAPGAAAVELLRDGQVLDRAERSRTPSVRLAAPTRGTRVRSRGQLKVRWRASDPDRDKLAATIDYSPDDGRTWRTVYDGPSTGRASIPGRLLPGSRRARIRLGVTDGFSERSVTSGRYTADGVAPRVQILAPPEGAAVRSGERTRLIGGAFDDLERPLSGRALTWFAGRKRLGTGAQLGVVLPPGTRRLRLVARDRTGRDGVARLPVRIARPRLRIIELAVPLRIAAGARSLRVLIRASAPATLVTRGRRFQVGTRSTTLTIPLPRRPAVGVVQVPFRLLARSQGVAGTVRGTFSAVRT